MHVQSCCFAYKTYFFFFAFSLPSASLDVPYGLERGFVKHWLNSVYNCLFNFNHRYLIPYSVSVFGFHILVLQFLRHLFITVDITKIKKNKELSILLRFHFQCQSSEKLTLLQIFTSKGFFILKKCRLRTADCRLQTADCGPGVKCRLSVKCRLQTESKTQAGCKMQNEDCTPF